MKFPVFDDADSWGPHHGRYVLNAEGEPEPCEDVLTWARFMENQDARRIALDKVGDVMISTVFMGLDHNFYGGEPLLFETMVFGGSLDRETDRYSTRVDAIQGHSEILVRVLNLTVPS